MAYFGMLPKGEKKMLVIDDCSRLKDLSLQFFQYSEPERQLFLTVGIHASSLDEAIQSGWDAVHFRNCVIKLSLEKFFNQADQEAFQLAAFCLGACKGWMKAAYDAAKICKVERTVQFLRRQKYSYIEVEIFRYAAMKAGILKGYETLEKYSRMTDEKWEQILEAISELPYDEAVLYRHEAIIWEDENWKEKATQKLKQYRSSRYSTTQVL